MNTPNREVRGTGHHVRVDPTHRAAGDFLEWLATRAERLGEHLWLMVTCFVMTPEVLANTSEPLLADSENLVSAHVGCYVCEQQYEPRLLKRRCPGEPKGR